MQRVGQVRWQALDGADAKQLLDHVRGQTALAKLEQKHADDVVITCAFRTPMCKARKGGLKDMRLDELMTEVGLRPSPFL